MISTTEHYRSISAKGIEVDDSRMIGAKEVSSQLNVSCGYAYRLIRLLNSELREQGRLTIPGKVNREYFEHRFFDCDGKDATDHDRL